MATSASGCAVATGAAARRIGASFRDPAAFVFTRDGVLYRQVNSSAAAAYDMLMSSGLYAALVDAGDLVSHEEMDPALSCDGRAYRVLKPKPVPFVSYPYEWCFSGLKDAALLTLRLQRTAMRFGMSLKDATAFNVQFDEGRPVWIDTLSFEPLRKGAPWVAYKQFCEFFVAPLALMSCTDVRLQQLLRVFLDGVPVEIASRLLPFRTRAWGGLGVHVHLHARAGHRTGKLAAGSDRRLPERALSGLIDSLDRTVKGLRWRPAGTVWGNYYDATNYTEAAFAHKRRIVDEALDRLQPSVVWDLGANDGTFSRLAVERGSQVLSFDVDPAAVEKNYRRMVERREWHLVPLVMDLTNPSPACGWSGQERMSLAERGPADVALALALVHHLAIGHNVPFDRQAAFFASVARALVIEFVPKADSQVLRMLATREDVFDEYSQDAFEQAFCARFAIEEVTRVAESQRTVYVMRRRDPRIGADLAPTTSPR
jgi:ribosomal protein L11 methylase PrmA